MYPEQWSIVYEAISRGGWFLYTLDGICRILEIDALNFLRLEVACICDSDLQNASNALEQISDVLLKQIPIPAANEFWTIAEVLKPENLALFPVVEILHRIDYEVNLSENESFYAFVKSLQQAVQEAIKQEGCLFFVTMQP
jgi:hypothetical protein